MNEYPPDAIDLVVESYNDTANFVKGLNILYKYRTEEFDICVVEIAALNVRGTKALSQEDLTALLAMGWNAGNGTESSSDRSWAEYYKLKYVDT